MNLSVPDTLPGNIAALLQQDRDMTEEITGLYDRLIYADSLSDAERQKLRGEVDRLKHERNIVEARLVGWWRSTLITNGHDWENMSPVSDGVLP